MSTQKAIEISYECLTPIYKEHAFSNATLNKTLKTTPSDCKPLVTKIVYGVLDKNIKLDYIIKLFAPQTKPALFVLLKIGAFCILELSIPSAVVVNDCVNYAKKIGKAGVANFVNAVLRNIAKAKEENSFEYPTEPLKCASIQNSYPLWALNKLKDYYGEEEAIKISDGNDDTATCLRINTALISVDEFKNKLVAKGLKFKQTCLDDAIKVYGDVTSLTASGECTPMSLSSMLTVRALNVKPDSNVLDLCAAPGGKSVYIAGLQPSAKIVACDVYPHRLRLISSYAKRMHADNVTVEQNDATEVNPAFFNKFDYVLLDAPCSGFGVVSSRPEIKMFRTEKDVDKLVEIQQKMLEIAKNYLKVGGVLLYSTCTVFAEENALNVKNFLEHNDHFKLIPLDLPIKSDDGSLDLQLLPHKHDTDGFYIAGLVKEK